MQLRISCQPHAPSVDSAVAIVDFSCDVLLLPAGGGRSAVELSWRRPVAVAAAAMQENKLTFTRFALELQQRCKQQCWIRQALESAADGRRRDAKRARVAAGWAGDSREAEATGSQSPHSERQPSADRCVAEGRGGADKRLSQRCSISRPVHSAAASPLRSRSLFRRLCLYSSRAVDSRGGAEASSSESGVRTWRLCRRRLRATADAVLTPADECGRRAVGDESASSIVVVVRDCSGSSSERSVLPLRPFDRESAAVVCDCSSKRRNKARLSIV